MAHIRDYERGNRAPSLRLTGYREGGISGFTTLTVELVYNGGVMPNVWQDTVLDDETIVWQTTDDGGFCNNSTFCTFGEFKQHIPMEDSRPLTVRDRHWRSGGDQPPHGVSLTINEDGTETTEIFHFDVVRLQPPRRLSLRLIPLPQPRFPPPCPAEVAAAAFPTPPQASLDWDLASHSGLSSSCWP